MKSGFVLDTIKKDNQGNFYTAVFCFVIAFIVFSFSYQRIFNSVAGPFPFDPVVAENAGIKQYFKVEGPLIATGVAQQSSSSIRLLHGAIESKSTDITALYFTAKSGSRLVVIKMPKEFSGQTVNGVAIPLPEDVKQYLANPARTADLTSASFYPMMIDATTGYIWDYNLFFWLALVVFAIGLFFLLFSLWRMMRLSNHPMYSYLQKQGPITTVIKKLEQEVILLGEKARIGPFYLTQNWLVKIDGSYPLFVAIKDWCGLGLLKEVSKKGDVSFMLRLFIRGTSFPNNIEAPAQVCQIVIQEIGKRMPWMIIQDPNTFSTRWLNDQKGCAQEIQAAKQKHESELMKAAAQTSSATS